MGFHDQTVMTNDDWSSKIFGGRFAAEVSIAAEVAPGWIKLSDRTYFINAESTKLSQYHRLSHNFSLQQPSWNVGLSELHTAVTQGPIYLYAYTDRNRQPYPNEPVLTIKNLLVEVGAEVLGTVTLPHGVYDQISWD